MVPQIIRHGKVIRPGLGVSMANRNLSHELGIKGVLIINVQKGSTAEKAGLQGTREVPGGIVLGDIIISVNGVAVSDYNGLRDELEKYQVGDIVTLSIIRDKETMQADVRLDAME